MDFGCREKGVSGIKQAREWVKSKCPLQAIYTCVGQMPSHNRVRC